MKLCFDAVQPALFTLLNRLMSMDVLRDFYLVGGTALALRLGHRVSEDIDLFTSAPFDARQLSEQLVNQVGMKQSESLRNTVRGFVDGIKLECIAHQYPLIESVETVEGIRIASLKDLAAFKGNAIANRGAKKDFWDIHALLKRFSREELLSFCGEKYRGESVWNLEKSLVYFDDADLDPDPRDLQEITWAQIKGDLIEGARRT
ncbi:MAG: nucleotidyl transferase AbiEii/AbiGii toxin family protein [Verrucomicrobia bacterium]|nr:nucleotidyl transferase AbiEii/AbiGii toxin family protein [Verrucomicrobiota bacterium]MCH8512474.1 nucleotidyl transferase AbiEii/AbiGii toxin family protein [Kiritimatiellia bacterium]